MVYCGNCGAQVSEQAVVCPSCGHPQGSVQPPGYAAPRTESSATTAMILGILSVVLCGIVTGVPAIIIGNNAKRKIAMDRSLGGEGMATAGIVLGWISVGFTVIAILFLLTAVGSIVRS
ncbi:MAG TPA: DUF4190 domain-containing protein [Actinomycetota bacterium]